MTRSKMVRKGDWMDTYTGKRFWPLDPRPEDVCVEDIAQGLSNICRYNGQGKFFFSVAQHSLNCAAYAKQAGLSKRMQLLCLLHDAAEAYVGDIIKPIKSFMPQFKKIEKDVQTVIYSALDVSPPTYSETEATKAIDAKMLLTEATALGFKWSDWRWASNVVPDTNTNITQEPAEMVRSRFVDMARECRKALIREGKVR